MVFGGVLALTHEKNRMKSRGCIIFMLMIFVWSFFLKKIAASRAAALFGAQKKKMAGTLRNVPIISRFRRSIWMMTSVSYFPCVS